MRPPQTFALAFLILSCTRGTAGVTFVASHIEKHWNLFRFHFHDFCKGLVRACRSECCKRGQQFLSHREGLHAALSGKHFLDTLARRNNRNALLRISEEWGAVIEGVFCGGGRVKALEASQVFALGDCLTTLALAEHNHRRRCMGPYNKRHTLRTFMVVHEKILGAPATAYTEELHRWFTRGLSKRSACVTFPASDARSFRESVTDLQAVLGSDFTVTWSTVFVLRMASVAFKRWRMRCIGAQDFKHSWRNKGRRCCEKRRLADATPFKYLTRLPNKGAGHSNTFADNQN